MPEEKRERVSAMANQQLLQPPGPSPDVPGPGPAAAPAAAGFYSDLPQEPAAWLPYEQDPARYMEDRDPKLETYFLVPDDFYEMQGARVWFAQHASDYPFDNLLVTLPMDLLKPSSIVYVLARKGTRMNPVKPVQPITGRGPEGQHLHSTRSAEELATEFGAYGGTRDKPGIRVGDPAFWNYRGGRLSGGGLQYDKLVDEICKFSMPEVPAWRDASERKPAPRPTQLYLRRV